MLRCRREERRERRRDCKLTGFDTRTKKFCERDKCAMVKS
jgi:hypothetical protein